MMSAILAYVLKSNISVHYYVYFCQLVMVWFSLNILCFKSFYCDCLYPYKLLLWLFVPIQTFTVIVCTHINFCVYSPGCVHTCMFWSRYRMVVVIWRFGKKCTSLVTIMLLQSYSQNSLGRKGFSKIKLNYFMAERNFSTEDVRLLWKK